MSSKASEFVGDIPENYDQGLGPHLFHDYGDDLARRAANIACDDVLEIAAGTGIVSRRLRDALPASTRLTVSDLNPPMLAIAEAKFDSYENVTFETADAMSLPFEDQSFDIVVCQFGVMFFPDKQVAYREANRVLRPGGSFLFNVWDNMDANPISHVAQDVGARFFPDDPPMFYTVPFGYADTEAVLADLSAAGFEDHEHEKLALEKQVTDWPLFARGLVYGNPLLDEIVTRGGVDPDEVMAEILTAARDKFGAEPGTLPLSATIYQSTKN